MTRHNIEVNHPLNYKGLKAYQFDYDLTPILRSVSPVLVDSKSGKEYGKITLSIDDPQREYQAGEYTLTLTQSFTDFGLGDNGKPVNLSPNPNAPAFLFLIKGPELPKEGIQYFYFPKQIDKERFNQEAINAQLAGGEALVQLDVLSMDDVDFSESTTYLNIRVDKAMPFIWIGCFIGMVGLVMGFYFTHRRIWLRIDNGTLTLGAHTNKNWFGLRKEVSAILKQMNIEVDEKSLENNRGLRMNLIDFSGDAFIVAFTLYCVAFIMYALAVMGRRFRKRDPEAHLAKWGKIAFVTASIGLIGHLLYFFTRWAGSGHVPVSNMYEFMTFCRWQS